MGVEPTTFPKPDIASDIQGDLMLGEQFHSKTKKRSFTNPLLGHGFALS